MSCVAPHADVAGLTRFPDLLDETHQLSTELTRTGTIENDTIENSLELIDRGTRTVTTACPPADTLDRALMLIAERHGVGSQ
jgi:hypothetical protein